MRRVRSAVSLSTTFTHTQPTALGVACRLYRTPLGGSYFEEPLPASLGASRAKGGLSTTNLSAKRRRMRRKLALRVPIDAEGIQTAMHRLIKENTEKGNVSPAPTQNTTPADAIVAVPGMPEVANEAPAVVPRSNVTGDRLDRMERLVLEDFHQRGAKLPALDPVDYVHPTHDTAHSTQQRTGQSEHAAQQELPRPAEENPHFPIGPTAAMEEDMYPNGNPYETCAVLGEASHAGILSDTHSHTSGKERANGLDRMGKGDASILPMLRDMNYWHDAAPRARLQQHLDYANEAARQTFLAEGAMDTCDPHYATQRVRKETLLYFQAHPMNEMIQEPFVRIVQGRGGGSTSHNDGAEEGWGSSIDIHSRANSETNTNGNGDAMDIPIAAARRMAREMGVDLIRIGAVHTDRSDRRVVALCALADHREELRDMLRFKLQKLGVQPPPTRPLVEVAFRGGTHPHALRFKSAGVARHLLRGHVVRLCLTDFGTPREGFPALRAMLQHVHSAAERLKAFHTAATPHATYNEITCDLFPSTPRSLKTCIHHPTDTELQSVRDRRILEDEREVYFDDWREKPTARERRRYEQRLADGTAWADKDDGLSLRRQRDMKVMLGYLPKGNREMYAARGDVDVPAPFRASHPTSVERWSNPQETNMEQACRGAAVLGKRHAMSISEMHDRGETADNPSTLDRFYYRVQGPALEVGELKEAFGLKRNRKTLPRLAHGWATLGKSQTPEEEPWKAAK